MKKIYLEVIQKPANFGDVIKRVVVLKRVDVTGYAKKEINSKWDEIDSEIDKEKQVSRQITVDNEMGIL